VHIGIAARSDVDSSFDLARALSEAGLSVSLYLSHKHLGYSLNELDHPHEALSALRLLPSGVRVTSFAYPRMRDPRSFLVVHRLGRAMHEDKVDIAHILMGPGELWLALLACQIRQIPVAATMVIPEANIGDRLPARLIRMVNKVLTLGSDVIILNSEAQVSRVEEIYGVDAGRLAYVPLCARTTAIRWSRWCWRSIAP